jgi:SH3-like domain-containing protein
VTRIFLLALALAAIAQPALAHRYESLRSDKAYLREGPSQRNRILFVYERKGYPFEVIATYDGWARVRDADGVRGWISQTLLTEARTVLVRGKGRVALRVKPFAAARLLAWVEPGVVAKLKACKPQFCEVSVGGATGWIVRSRIWGVDAGEILD